MRHVTLCLCDLIVKTIHKILLAVCKITSKRRAPRFTTELCLASALHAASAWPARRADQGRILVYEAVLSIHLHSSSTSAQRCGSFQRCQLKAAHSTPSMQRQQSDASSTLTDALEEGAGAAQTQRIFRQEHEFVRDDDADAENARRWETRMARRYYDALHKEYAICDLSRWREGAVGLRWRTAAEVTSG